MGCQLFRSGDGNMGPEEDLPLIERDVTVGAATVVDVIVGSSRRTEVQTRSDFQAVSEIGHLPVGEAFTPKNENRFTGGEVACGNDTESGIRRRDAHVVVVHGNDAW